MMSKSQKQIPYVGPRPFEKQDEGLFFGRDCETNELLSLVIAHRVFLLYAISGAGKTSLINAGLIPLLEEEGFEVFPIARVGGEIPKEMKPDDIANIYVFNTLRSWQYDKDRDKDKDKDEQKQLAQISLASFLEKRKHYLDEDGLPLPRAIIFDQLEELLTFYPSRQNVQGEREEFFRQIAEALESDLRLRILFVIRDDYLGSLDPYVSFLPERLRARYRLEPLGREAARLAVQKPLEGTGRSISDEVASSIVQELIKTRVKGVTGGIVEVAGEYVEPVQLQIVCGNLWNGLPSDVTVITSDHLQSFGNVDEALKNFYEETLKATESKTGVKEGDLRNWFHSQLVTPTGTRGFVYRGRKLTGGIPNTVVDALEDLHIIRAELRSGEPWYELTHDRLIKPIQKSNNVWRKHKNEEEQKQKVEKERQRADEQTKTARRFRRLTSALIVVFLLAAGTAVYASLQRHKAIKAELSAREAEMIAVTAMNKSIKTEDALRISWGNLEETNKKLKAATNLAKNESKKAREQANLAELRRKEAFSRELAAAAINNLNKDPEFCILLALQAVSVIDSSGKTALSEVRDALRRAIQASRLRFTLSGHVSTVTDIAFSPNGARLATADAGGLTKLWNVETGQEELILIGHSGSVNGVAFSPDGNLLATCSKDGTAIVWEVETGQKLFSLSSHINGIQSISFSSDCTRLVTASEDGTAKVWKATSGEELFTLAGHASHVQDVDFSPDGTRLATASQDNTVKMWDAKSGHEVFTIPRQSKALEAISFSPNGELLATASIDGSVKIWNAFSGSRVRTLPGHANLVWDIDFSPDSKKLASAGYDGIVKVWDINTGIELFKITERLQYGVLAVTFSPNGKQIATTSGDKVKVWTTTSDEEVLSFTAHSRRINSVVHNPEGVFFASASNDCTAKVWNAFSGEEVIVLKGHTKRVESVAFNNDGTRLATASDDGIAKVWNTTSGKTIFALKGHKGGVNDIAFSPDGMRLATASDDTTVKIWDAISGQGLATLSGHTNEILDICFNLDGTRLASASGDYTAKVWDTVSGIELITLKGHTIGLLSVEFSPDGKYIVTTSKDKTAKLWDAYSGNEIRAFLGHNGTVMDVAFSSDGKRIATASFDKTVKLWDVTSGQELYTFLGHTDGINSLAFSPDDRYLVTAGDDGTVRVFTMNIDDLIELGRKRITRSFTAVECQKFFHGEECPQTAMGLIAEGRELATKLKLKAAIERFRKAQLLDPYLKIDPELEAKKWMASKAYSMGKKLAINAKKEEDLEDAYKAFLLVQNLDPDIKINPESEVIRALANGFIEKGRESASSDDLDSAYTNFEKALRINPALKIDPDRDSKRLAALTLIDKGDESFHKNKIDEAIKFIERAVSLNPIHDKAYQILGRCYKKKEEYDKAITSLQKAIEIHPTPLSFAELADCFRLIKDYPKAIAFANEAVKINRYYDYGYLVLGQTKYAMEDYESAVNILKNVTENDLFSSVSALNISGTIYFDKLFELEAAYEKFKRAVELFPGIKSVEANFAEVTLASGRFEEAYALAKKVIDEPNILQQVNVDNQIAMRFIILCSLLLQEQTEESYIALKELIIYYKSNFAEFIPGWSYAGTKHFISQRSMNENHRKLLLRLIDIIEKQTPDVTIEQLKVFLDES